MTSTRNIHVVAAFGLALSTLIVFASWLHADTFEINSFAIAGGGASSQSSGSYEITSTIGQFSANATTSDSGEYGFASGFLSFALPMCFITAPSDFDRDCDVDADDLGAFVLCASGPNILLDANPACQWADLDADGDVDQVDFGMFQRCYSGANAPTNTNCAD